MLGRCDDVVMRGQKKGGGVAAPGFCCPTGISSGNNLHHLQLKMDGHFYSAVLSRECCRLPR